MASARLGKYISSRPGEFPVEWIDRVPATNLSVADFKALYAGKRPVVLTGGFDGFGAAAWDPKSLGERCDRARVRAFQHVAGSESWSQLDFVKNVSLAEFVADQVTGSPLNPLYGFEMTLVDECPELLSELPVLRFFAVDAFHVATKGKGTGWPSIFIGPATTQTGCHIDTHFLPFWIATANAARPAAVLKHFRTLSAADTGDYLAYASKTKRANFVFHFDPWAPDFGWYPKLKGVRALDANLTHGDVLYVPPGMPHLARNVEANVGVSMNYLDMESFTSFARSCREKWKRSPLCAMLSGTGEQVLTEMEQRDKSVLEDQTYLEWAGHSDRTAFCEIHPEPPPRSARSRYCGFEFR